MNSCLRTAVKLTAAWFSGLGEEYKGGGSIKV